MEDEEEFNSLQTLHLETLNEFTSIDCRMEVEYRSPVLKPIGRDQGFKIQDSRYILLKLNNYNIK